ncbi:spoIIIJ-associated protein [Lachnospiraceae bacterium KH1T2]|nr:spoIIIJ-associated protein [Lachnospiraceae bacterium KH1T2]
MDYIEVSGKSLENAISEACKQLSVTADHLEYEIVDLGTSGFLGFNSKPTIIKAKVKEAKAATLDVQKDEEVVSEVSSDSLTSGETVSVIDADDLKKKVNDFLNDVFGAMKMDVTITVDYDEKDSCVNVDLEGDEMGILIGKRGQTLDSLQYLISLIVNKGKAGYIRVKVDTENYRARRQKTLENLARNLSFKVKRTKRPVSLEPMNPYERRIIHSALQNDRYVTTHSEGEEPFRRVVITLKK